MRLQQDTFALVPDDISEKLAMFADRAKALGDAIVVAADNFLHGKGQQALCSFLKGRVEDLVHLMAQVDSRDRGRRNPQ
jgi:hypothetical protein